MHDSNQFSLTRAKGFEKGKRESRKQKFNQNKRKESGGGGKGSPLKNKDDKAGVKFKSVPPT